MYLKIKLCKVLSQCYEKLVGNQWFTKKGSQVSWEIPRRSLFTIQLNLSIVKLWLSNVDLLISFVFLFNCYTKCWTLCSTDTSRGSTTNEIKLQLLTRAYKQRKNWLDLDKNLVHPLNIILTQRDTEVQALLSTPSSYIRILDWDNIKTVWDMYLADVKCQNKAREVSTMFSVMHRTQNMLIKMLSMLWSAHVKSYDDSSSRIMPALICSTNIRECYAE